MLENRPLIVGMLQPGMIFCTSDQNDSFGTMNMCISNIHTGDGSLRTIKFITNEAVLKTTCRYYYSVVYVFV